MIKWSDNFSVKHTGIDEQHKKLINIIDEVAFAIGNEDYQFTKLIEIVSELDNYVKEHFQYEETLMKECSYPGEAEHIKQHNILTNKLDELNIFEITNTIDFYNEILVYLVEWLSNHIMQTDKKLGLFLNK